MGTANRLGPAWRARGEFEWNVDLTTDHDFGTLVQEVTNTVVSSKPGWRPSHATYWEAWHVTSGKVEKGEDHWYRPAQAKWSHGHWSMDGRFYFVPLQWLDGFEERGVTEAGTLLSTAEQPEDLGEPFGHRRASGRWGPIRGHRGRVQ